MKKYNQRPMRHALAVLTAGLVLGGLVAANAQNSTVFPTNVYYMSQNAPIGTLAPYSAGGGVPAQSLLGTPVQTSSNWSISWYGMRGWSTIQGSTNLGGTWINLTNVAATNYSWTTALPIPSSWSSASFRLSQLNTYVGQAACAGCHADKYNGWTNTLHSSAVSMILNPDGTFTSSHANSSCLLCHTVGNGQPTGYIYASNSASYSSVLANVGCEDCHGPAGWHKASEKDMITPAVSMDPAICGSCHQGHNPQYNEYTNSIHAQRTTSHATSFSCAPCHQANNRMAMVAEYYDSLAGNPHPLTPFSSTDATAWTVTCANCHDPHGTTASPVFGYVTNIVVGVSTNVAWTNVSVKNVQLRNPLWSSNFYTMPAVSDGTANTTFDTFYNPNVNICGQCHNTRGARWDGFAYGVITNSVIITNVLQPGYYAGVITYVTNMQVFTNISYGYIYTNGASVGVTNITMTTNSYAVPYVTNQVWMPGITTYVTNSTHTVGLTSNRDYSRGPHLSPQYNMLIGILQPDYMNTTNGSTVYTNGVINNGMGIYATHAGIKASSSYNTNQCATCHVPSYTSPTGNITGHTFNIDPNGCALGGCHSTFSSYGKPGAPDYIDYALQNSNAVVSVANLLNAWATNNGPALFPANYANYLQNSWEYTAPGSLASITNGGPSASDQLLLPTNILQARYDIYMVNNDGTFGTHNPTFIPLLIKDAETKVLSQLPVQFTTKSASHYAFVNYGAPGATFTFTNLSPTIGLNPGWDFGDGTTTNTTAKVVTHQYPNIVANTNYTVTLTDGTNSLTRNNFISIYAAPTPSFTYGTSANHTLILTNTSINANYGNWAFYTNSVSNANGVGGKASPMGVPQFLTFTSGGSYIGVFTAYNPGGSASVTNNITVP
jgi:Cytochrome c554 and c-prime